MSAPPTSAPTGPLTGTSTRTNRYTVAELRQALAGLPDDTEVVISATCDCEDEFEHDIYAASYTAGLLTIDPA